MNCPNCGAILIDEYVKFCPKCGTKLHSDDVSSGFRLQKAFVPELDYGKDNADKTILSVSIKGVPINFNYDKSMYIMIRKPIDLRRSEWKNELVNHFKSKKDHFIMFPYDDFKSESLPFFNKGRESYIYWIVNHFKNIISNSSHFVRDTYRKPIEEKISYTNLANSVSELAFEKFVREIEDMDNQPREVTETRRHSQVFSSPAGFGVWNTVKGSLVAGALNYSIDAAGALFDYAGQVKENINRTAYKDSLVPDLKEYMLLSCDCAADKIANYTVNQCLDLCKLQSIDSGKYISRDEFKEFVFSNVKNIDKNGYGSENTIIERACKVLENNPYNFSVIKWLYSLNPSLDDELINYGKFLNVQDIIETTIDDVERQQYKNNYCNPFLNTYCYYNPNYYNQF